MLANPVRAESATQVLACDVAASKKTTHSPWTASKPRKKNRQLDDGDGYQGACSISIGLQNDENVPPAGPTATAGSLDVNMLASGFERLRVFRKASGVKGARRPAGEGQTASKDGCNVNNEAHRYGARPQDAIQAHAPNSLQSSLTGSFLSGVMSLRTVSDTACRHPGLPVPGTFGGQLPHDRQDLCYTPGAQDSDPPSHNCFQQPFGVPAGFGAGNKASRDCLRQVDLTALSADAILMAPPAPRPPCQPPSSQDMSQAHSGVACAFQPHQHGAHADKKQDGAVLQGMEEHGCDEADEDDHHNGLDEDDRRPFLLPPLCLDGEEEGDVWDGCQEEEFRIVTRPLGWAAGGLGGPLDELRGAPPGWEAPPSRSGALYTPTAASCTPRVLVTGFAVTPATASTAPRSRLPTAPDSFGKPLIRYYGRAGYCSAAMTGPSGSATPGPRVARRAPTPAGHLLGQSFFDEEEEGEDGEQGMAVQGSTPPPTGGAADRQGEPKRGVALTLKAAAKKLVAKIGGSTIIPRPAADAGTQPSQRGVSRVSIFSPPAARVRTSRDQDNNPSDVDVPPSRGRNAPLAKLSLGIMGRRIGRRDTVDDLDLVASRDVSAGGYEEPQVDLELKQRQDEEALANLMCDECDFCTPPHSPKLHGLPHWLHSEHRPSEIRRTHSADEAMMSRDLGHPPSHNRDMGHARAPVAAHAPHHMHHAVSFQGASMLHPAASLDAGMELAFGMLPMHHGQPACSMHHPAHMIHLHELTNEVSHGLHMESRGMGEWAGVHAAWSSAHGSSGAWGMESGMGSHGHGHMEEDGRMGRDMVMPVQSLDTLEEFNAQLSLAAGRGDRGRAERLWGELRNRCILPDMRTLNMLMRCLCKSIIDPDEAEELMCEVCTLGGLQPNATTLTLLAEMRLRYEHLQG